MYPQKLKALSFIVCCILLAEFSYTQSVGIGTNTPDASAQLHISSNNKGVLFPSVILSSDFDNTTIPDPATGLIVWHNSKSTLEGLGLYMNIGNPLSPLWKKMVTNSDMWSLKGNTSAEGAKLGHVDFRPLQFIAGNQHIGRLGGNSNILLGLNSGNNLSQTENFLSYNNIVIGNEAMATANAGTNNIALGNSAMSNATGGGTGIAIGGNALNNQATGALENIAIGFSSLLFTTSGSNNIGIGRQALWSNTTGSRNIGIGFSALEAKTVGMGSVAIGYGAMSNMAITELEPNGNLAIGYEAMIGSGIRANNTGYSNVAIGMDALRTMASGNNNVAIGRGALRNVFTGSGNTALGSFAGANTEGSNNLILGAVTGSFPVNRTISGSVFIGNNAGRQETTSNKLYIDNTGGTAFDALVFGDFATGLFRINGRQQLKGSGANTGIEFNYNGSKAAGAGRIGYGLEVANRLELFGGAAAAGQRTINMYAEGGTFFSGEVTPFNNETQNLGNLSLRWNIFYTKTVNATALLLSQASGDHTGIVMGHNVALKQADAGKIQYGGFGGSTHVLNIVGGGTAADGSNRIIKLWSEGGLRMRGNFLPDGDNVYSLGNNLLRWSSVWSTNGTIQTSDANLKTNIQPSPYGLNEVLQMNPVQYNWKEAPTGNKEVGLLAQDVLKLIPEAVVVPDDGSAMGMKYSELIPVLIKAIQEQQKEIENLKKLIKK